MQEYRHRIELHLLEKRGNSVTFREQFILGYFDLFGTERVNVKTLDNLVGSVFAGDRKSEVDTLVNA